ncbi:MAG TPA: type VI secretion system baseplate subunit TssG [Planctomycetota bacterium]|nr:type VI secretion system baseplate subunit TssG [Planctomycetota bacterium]
MAAEGRWQDHPLSRQLLAEPHRFSFYRIVQLLQILFPNSAPVGTQGPPEREVIRFRSDLSLAFSSSDVQKLTVEEPNGAELPRFELTTAFLGMYGAGSPLPIHFTETLLHQDEDVGITRPFMDLFHHRTVSMLYRVWEKYRHLVRFRFGGIDPLSRLFLLLAGLLPDPETPQPRIPAIRLLAYAGLWTQRTRPATALRGILSDYFPGITVEIEQFAGRWLDIPEEEQCRVGAHRNRLGQDMNIGGRIFDRGASFRVRLDRLGLADYLAFLPPGDKTAELEEIVDRFNTDGLDYEVKLWLRREEIPALKLGGPEGRLGWSTWIGKAPGANQSLSYKMKGRIHGQR